MLGVSEEHFWNSCPTDLQPYVRMDEMTQERLDAQMWQMGIYVNNAVYVAVAKALAGKKAHVSYMNEPLMQTFNEEERNNAADDFQKFSAWATVYNETKFGGQGE